jgi:hypothetical protein
MRAKWSDRELILHGRDNGYFPSTFSNGVVAEYTRLSNVGLRWMFVNGGLLTL